MSGIDPTPLLQPAATRVRDPLSGRSIWLAGMVGQHRYDDGVFHVTLKFQDGHSGSDRKGISAALRGGLAALGFAGTVEVQGEEMTSGPKTSSGGKGSVRGMHGPGLAPHGGPIQKKPLAGVKHVIAVASGKGGVGKSTVSTNLAIGLSQLGRKVGLLDADVYGPSLPTMMNLTQRPMVNPETKKIMPVMAYGVRCISMGLLVDPKEAMIWRGPMVMGAVRQFIQDVNWDGLDDLIIDLPPGTGDTQLTLIQAVDIQGAIIVTTPQDVALADAVRGITMFEKLGVPLLGLVENMAYYALPDGTRDFVFGEGGGVRLASSVGTEVLGQVPLETAIRKGGDQGLPAALGSEPTAQAFHDIAARVAAMLPVDG